MSRVAGGSGWDFGPGGRSQEVFPGINKGVEPEAFRGVSSQGAGLWAGWAVPGGAASSPGAGGGCGESEGGGGASRRGWSHGEEGEEPRGGGPGLLDGDLGALPPLGLQPHQDLQDGLGPVAAVREEPQVRQRLLGGPRLPLHLGELVAFWGSGGEGVMPELAPPPPPQEGLQKGFGVLLYFGGSRQ